MRRTLAPLVLALALPTVASAATFHVDPATGDDSRTPAQAESPTTPWRTLTHALTAGGLTAGDVLRVAPGLYDATSGEVFPLPILPGVTVVGSGDTTVIVGTSDDTLFASSGVALPAGTAIRGLRLWAVDSVEATGVSIVDPGAGTSIELTDLTFAAPLARGVTVRSAQPNAGAFTGRIAGNTFTTTRSGLLVEWSGGGEVTPRIEGNRMYAVETPIVFDHAWGTSALDLRPVLVDNVIAGTARGGVVFDVEGPAAGSVLSPRLDGNVIRAARDGVSISFQDLPNIVVAPVLTHNDVSADQVGIDLLFGAHDSTTDLPLDAHVDANLVHGEDAGVHVRLRNLPSGTTTPRVQVAHNTASSTWVGVLLTLDAFDHAGAPLALDVVGNDITTWSGSGISLTLADVDAGALALAGVIASNHVRNARDAGVEVETSVSVGAFSGARVLVADNVAAGADAGLSARASSVLGPLLQVERNALGGNVHALRVDGASSLVDAGGGALGAEGLNLLVPFGFANALAVSAPSLSVARNWWGTTDAETMADLISKPKDTTVDASLPLTEAPTRGADVVLSSVIEEDTGPAGPSLGDTLRFTAQVAATADLGCAVPELRIEHADGVTGDPDSLNVDGPYAVELDDAWHVGLGVLPPGTPTTVTWLATLDAVEACGAVEVQAVLRCDPLVSTLRATTEVGGVGSEEIADDGIDQDCDGDDLITPPEPVDTDEPELEERRGCSTAPDAHVGLLSLGALALVRRRRRR